MMEVFKDHGNKMARYVVISLQEILEAEDLLAGTLAQKAEVITLTLFFTSRRK